MVTTGDRREPPADTKCPPASQRKQAKRACMDKMAIILTSPRPHKLPVALIAFLLTVCIPHEPNAFGLMA